MKPLVKHSKNAVAAAVVFSILVLSGCGIPQLRPPLPAQPLPQSYNLPPGFSGATNTENSAQVPLREFFTDPNLTSLINQALVGNLQLKILFEDIQIANNEIMRRRGAYLPFLSFGSAARLDKYSYNTLVGADNLQNIPLNAPSFPTPLPDFLAPAAELSWQIDIWRQLRNARDAQALRWLGTTDGRNYVVTRLVADMAENYYALMALDARMENLNNVIALQERSLAIAEARMAAARSTALGVQRFLAEVRKNQSERRILSQQIIETENKINFLAGRYPQRVERNSAGFIDLNLHPLVVGLPSQLLQNRPDIRQAERELQAAGLDIRVTRKNFFPKLFITGGVGYEAFNPKYLYLTPESLIYNVAGGLVAPLVNRAAIRADYLNANAKQLQALYDYQRTVLNAFTEVVNQVNGVQNYSGSIALKKQQVRALERSVDIASNLFQNARIEYIDVLFAQRDMWQSRRDLIDTKQQQLTAIVDTYQALGGGWQNGLPQAAPPAAEEVPVPPPDNAAPPPPAVNAAPPGNAGNVIPPPNAVNAAPPQNAVNLLVPPNPVDAVPLGPAVRVAPPRPKPGEPLPLPK
ncbi:MAG TPA: TolC family protein [Pirellulales bacterium]|nr:TolC family protein [Pirellulales bacterium]